MNWDIRQGDALARLREMPDESVHCCVTSPPYWGLRDYGCTGQIGLEKTPDEFVARLVEVFREVRRALRSDGTLWVNIGDSYASGSKSQTVGSSIKSTLTTSSRNGHWAPGNEIQSFVRPELPFGLKPKDLVGIPWMLAFALRADGWYLRSEIIWHKPNPMPESVTDRPTKAHEQVFLCAKSKQYAYDADAIAESAAYPGNQGFLRGSFTGESATVAWRAKSQITRRLAGADSRHGGGDTRNKRTVWTLATLPTPDAHFATFPIELPETCILAGCPADGIVLDPFAGAGTTGLAALKHGRRFIGLELNEEYIQIAHRRAERHYPLLVEASA